MLWFWNQCSNFCRKTLIGLYFICVCLPFPSLCFHWPLSLLWDGSCLSLVLEFSIAGKIILKSDSGLDYGLDFGMDSRTYELTSRFQAFPPSSLWSLPALSQRLQLYGAYTWQHFGPRQCICLTQCIGLTHCLGLTLCLGLSYGEIAIIFHNSWWVHLLRQCVCTVNLPPRLTTPLQGIPFGVAIPDS